MAATKANITLLELLQLMDNNTKVVLTVVKMNAAWTTQFTVGIDDYPNEVPVRYASAGFKNEKSIMSARVERIVADGTRFIVTLARDN